MALLVGAGLLAPCLAGAGTITKIPNDGGLTLMQPGPLPGTVIVRSLVYGLAYGSGGGEVGEKGASMGECYALVKAAMTRDFVKVPVTAGEVLGFSCGKLPQ